MQIKCSWDGGMLHLALCWWLMGQTHFGWRTSSTKHINNESCFTFSSWLHLSISGGEGKTFVCMQIGLIELNRALRTCIMCQKSSNRLFTFSEASLMMINETGVSFERRTNLTKHIDATSCSTFCPRRQNIGKEYLTACKMASSNDFPFNRKHQKPVFRLSWSCSYTILELLLNRITRRLANCETDQEGWHCIRKANRRYFSTSNRPFAPASQCRMRP